MHNHFLWFWMKLSKEFEEIIFTSAGVTELFVGATDSSFAHRRFNGGKALFNVLWNNLKSFPTALYFSRPLFSLTIFHHYFLHLPSIYIFSVLFLCVWSLLYTWWSAEQTQAMKCVWMLVFVSLILLLLLFCTASIRLRSQRLSKSSFLFRCIPLLSSTFSILKISSILTFLVPNAVPFIFIAVIFIYFAWPMLFHLLFHIHAVWKSALFCFGVAKKRIYESQVQSEQVYCCQFV